MTKRQQIDTYENFILIIRNKARIVMYFSGNYIFLQKKIENFKICEIMTKNFRTILLCAVGIISIALSIKCYSFKDLDYETKSAYGGDAFTGIQNAAATTSKNVKEWHSCISPWQYNLVIQRS